MGGFGGLAELTAPTWLVPPIAEMTAALPAHRRRVILRPLGHGPVGGFVTGLAENMEYVLTPAVVVFFTGSYLGAIFETPEWFQPIWWLLGYIVFVGLNVWGRGRPSVSRVLITLLALAALAVLWVGAIPHFDFANLVNIAPEEGNLALAAQGRRGHPVRASIRDLVLSRDRAAPARRRGASPADP